MGSLNVIMQMNPEMIAKYHVEAQSLIASHPLWAAIIFAIDVFGGVLAVALLLLKKAIAYFLFITSFLSIIITNIHTVQLCSAIDTWVDSLMSFIIAAFLIGCTKHVKNKVAIKDKRVVFF